MYKEYAMMLNHFLGTQLIPPYLELYSGRKLVVSARTIHRYPQCKWVASNLLLGGSCSRRDSARNGNRNRRLAIVSTRCVDIDALD